MVKKLKEYLMFFFSILELPFYFVGKLMTGVDCHLYGFWLHNDLRFWAMVNDSVSIFVEIGSEVMLNFVGFLAVSVVEYTL